MYHLYFTYGYTYISMYLWNWGQARNHYSLYERSLSCHLVAHFIAFSKSGTTFVVVQLLMCLLVSAVSVSRDSFQQEANHPIMCQIVSACTEALCTSMCKTMGMSFVVCDMVDQGPACCCRQTSFTSIPLHQLLHWLVSCLMMMEELRL